MDTASLNLYEKLFDHAGQGMLASDRSGLIRMANFKANSLFGYEKEGLVGYRIADLVPEEKRQTHETLREDYFSDPSSRMMGEGRELEGLRKDGSVFPIEIHLNHLTADDGEIWVVSSMMDISVRLRSQKLIELAIIEFQEKERQRIARDLHDGVLQQLSALSLNIKAIPDPIDPELKGTLEDLTEQVVQEARGLTEHLRPPELEEKGLVQAIQDMLNSVERNNGISTRLNVQNRWSDRSSEYEVALYRICQEGVNNAVKHANAISITVELEDQQEQGVQFRIIDDGKGLPPEKGSEEQTEKGGMGFTNIRQRIEALNGHLKIWSEEGKGTVLDGFMPIDTEL